MIKTSLSKIFLESIEVKLNLLRDADFMGAVESVGGIIINTLKNGNKILIAGNGGSAADAQHFAAELAGKFVNPNRRGLPAIALTANSSITTAIGNDFGYEFVFSRQLEALGNAGDVFVAISTSGNSKNILQALASAKRASLFTIGLTGNNGGLMGDLCDLKLVVPSSNTQYIQEAHIMIIHGLCLLVDSAFENEQDIH